MWRLDNDKIVIFVCTIPLKLDCDGRELVRCLSPNWYFLCCCLRKCKDIQFWRPSLHRVFKRADV